jgi:hypothetical protein
MVKRILSCLVMFLVVVSAHAAWISTRPACDGGCSDCGGPPEAVGLSGYLEGQSYYLGLSYGLSAAFALYALWLFVEGRRAAGAAAAAGGISFAGALSAFGCFMTGCCGSPMLAVYAGFLGGTVLSFIKPLALAVTAVSVGIGFWWLHRKKPAAACCAPGKCDGC